MAYRLLRREGWTVNHQRVLRIWREEGLQRPTPRKGKRARLSDGSVRRHRAHQPHQVWAMDFEFDATAASAWRYRWAGAARPRMGWRCWRSSPAPTRRLRSSDRTTGRNSLPSLCGTGERRVAPPPRPTSSQDPPGRTALPRRMSSVRLRLQRPAPG